MYRRNELRSRINEILLATIEIYSGYEIPRQALENGIDELEQLFNDYISKNNEHRGETDIGSSSLRG